MKKINLYAIYLCLLLILGTREAAGQTKNNGTSIEKISSSSPKEESKNIVRTVTDLKTGNWQDVLSSFFQLSVSDLTGVNKALNFKANLFALKVKADSNLLIDKNYVEQKFARNFQFDFSLKLDSQYSFKGFRGGFTWALINKRDSSIISFARSTLDGFHLAVQKDLQSALSKFENSLIDSTGEIPEKNIALWNKVSGTINEILDKQLFIRLQQYPKEFQPFLQKSYEKNVVAADSLFDLKLAELRMKPLLTLSMNSTFENKERTFNSGSAQLIYLQGIKSKRTKTELDIRSFLNIKDTIVTKTERRAELNASAGINFTLLESNTGKSIIEFKPYFEYTGILTKPFSGEKKNLFLANADLRLRISDNFWVPLTIKYDIEKGNFLGFLDVELNFDALKKQK